MTCIVKMYKINDNRFTSFEGRYGDDEEKGNSGFK